MYLSAGLQNGAIHGISSAGVDNFQVLESHGVSSNASYHMKYNQTNHQQTNSWPWLVGTVKQMQSRRWMPRYLQLQEETPVFHYQKAP